MSQRFENKTVLITGAASGLGLASAIQLAREGARLALVVSRQACELREVVLSRGVDGVFVLSFWLESEQAVTDEQALLDGQEADVLPSPAVQGTLIPDYVSVEVN